MNIEQTGAWKDTVDQRLSDIGTSYFGTSDPDTVAGYLHTVDTRPTASSTVNGISGSDDGVSSNPVQEVKRVNNTIVTTVRTDSVGTSRTWTENSIGNKYDGSAREAGRAGIIDAIGFTVDSAMEDIAMAFGKKITSPLGTVASGVLTAWDLNATINNKSYSMGQKIGKAAIQVGGGMICVGVGTPIAEASATAAPFTGGVSIAGGAALIGYLAYNVNRLQNYLYNKLGL